MGREVSPIRWRKGETLRLGVVVDWPLAEPGRYRPWPEHLYAHLADEGASKGVLVCLFNPAAVDWRRGRVHGWVKASWNGQWEPRVLPLPHAVYNRISRREVEKTRACRRTIARLAQAAPLFNPRYLDKGEAQHALERSPVSPHVPAAWVTQSADEAARRIKELPAAFVKPVRGSLGEGVVRVDHRDGGYVVTQNPPLGSGERAPRRRRITRSQLRRFLAHLAAGRALLVQEAVELARWRGLPFDLRLLVQKDPDGRWRLTGAAGRVAAPGALTTHTVRGGTAVPFARLSREASAPMPSLPLLEAIGGQAAAAVEQAMGEDCFEFSLDTAVSPDGRPWILEINAKPFPFDEPEIRKEAARRLLAYAEAKAAGRGRCAPAAAVHPGDRRSEETVVCG